MKLDLDFIKKILIEIEENTTSKITLAELMKFFSLTEEDDNQLDILAGHIRIIRDAGFINSTNPDCGFQSNMNSTIASIDTGNKYELTLQGYQILDALRNDNLMNKIKSYISEIGITALKNAPAYIIGIAKDYITAQL